MARTDTREDHERRHVAALRVLQREALQHGRVPRGIIAKLRADVPGLSRDGALKAKAAWDRGERPPRGQGEPEPAGEPAPTEGTVRRSAGYRFARAKPAPPAPAPEPAPKSDPPPPPPPPEDPPPTVPKSDRRGVFIA